MKTYKSQGKVWVYAAEKAAWHFVCVDEKNSQAIKSKSKNRTAFGSVKVIATIGKTAFQTSLFPDKRSGCYLLPLKKSVRDREDIFEGEVIDFLLSVND